MREVPVAVIGRVFVAAEGVVHFYVGRQEGLGEVEDFAAVGTVAVCGEVLVELVLEADGVARGRVGCGGCEGPALVARARDVVVAGVVVEVVLGDLVETAADGVGDGFYDFGGCCGGGGEVGL